MIISAGILKRLVGQIRGEQFFLGEAVEPLLGGTKARRVQGTVPRPKFLRGALVQRINVQ